MSLQAFSHYIGRINKVYGQGIATEHSHRGSLEQLVTSLDSGIEAINEPKRIECGAPDFLINRRVSKRNLNRIGHIETKDIGKNLTKEARSEQIKKRYLPSLHNFILTDYIEFRWYVGGEHRMTARLAEEAGEKFKLTEAGAIKVGELFSQFFAQQPERITGAKQLAVKMGHMARYLCDVIKAAFEREDTEGNLHTQFEGFRQVLLHDLDQDQFADMYAQTICYGLFTAACNLEGPDELTRQNAEWKLPKTNPFLQKMFRHIAGPDLDERIAWLVDDIVALLNNTQMDSVLQDFAKQSGRQDPVVHFYETFLKEYNPRLRETRGVYYTPEPVVGYIVRSVDRLLKDKFALPRGLADNSKAVYKTGEGENAVEKQSHRCLILDPACGTGTFLFEVIRQIEQQVKQSQRGGWSGYVGRHLLPRLFGFELLMAPYTVAHMKLGLELQRSGYDFSSDERVGIYLTNTLEEVEQISKNVFVQWISDEARAANKVKDELPIMVVLGNPPYSGLSANMNEWTDSLLKKKLPLKNGAQSYYEVDGKPLGEKKVWLQDDYVKFIRFGQYRIEQTGAGVLAFITNNGYLDNPTFRGMRQSLMQTFDEIYLLNLHGSVKKKETTPDGGKDENVFDIQQGVSIGIFIRNKKRGKSSVCYKDIWGVRNDKYQWLENNAVESTQWKGINPQSPYYFFVERDERNFEEYKEFAKINEVLPINTTGIVTARDKIVIDFNEAKLVQRIAKLKNPLISDEQLRRQLFPNKSSGKYPPGDTRGWKLPEAREKIRGDKDWDKRVANILYRPFDIRKIYYSDWMVDWPRPEVMRHMLAGENLGLISARSNKSMQMDHFYCSKYITETKCGESTTQSCLFPLYKYPTVEKAGLFESSEWPEGKDGRVPNLDKGFIEDFAGRVGLEFVSDGRGDLERTFGPEDLFDYIYAVFHSPWYRQRYAEFLKIDFPRVPWIDDKARFVELVRVGDELKRLHLLESDVLADESGWPKFEVPGSGIVEKGYPRWIANEGESGRVYINAEQYFEPVELDVWEFHIGGYQVCAKWLKDRRNRELSFDEIEHYQKMTVAIKQTIKLMEQLQSDDLVVSG